MNRVRIAAFAAVSLGFAWGASAETFNVLYDFCAGAQCSDGAVPYGQLLLAPSGVLYGTTSGGGTYNHGTVFALTPDGQGGWTQSVLHSFCDHRCSDGSEPLAGLIQDVNGKLYGTTSYHGAAFRLDPQTQQFDVLAAVGDSSAPLAFSGSSFDGASPLFGTAAHDGKYGQGSVFELVQRANGKWRKKVQWDFCAGGGTCVDGANPKAGLVADPKGLFLGVTQAGGTDVNGKGVIYQLSRQGNRETVQFTFSDASGGWPYAALTPVMYGSELHSYYLTTSISGRFFDGTFLEYTPNDHSVFLRGDFSGQNGVGPLGGVVVDSSHNGLGTAFKGGNTTIDPDGGGTIFEYFNMTHGLNAVHYFCAQANCIDGKGPASGLVADGNGNYYGTTTAGGAHNKGIVFRFRP